MSFLSHTYRVVYVFFLIAFFSFPNSLLSQREIRVRIDNSMDDLEEYLNTLPITGQAVVGFYDLDNSDLELGSELAGSNAHLVGLRFNNLDIPQGAAILSAYINFRVDATDKNTDPCMLTIQGEAADNSLPFDNTQRFNLSTRTKTTNSVQVSIDQSSWANPGDEERVDSLQTVIQEIIDRPGWVKGNSLSLFISGDGLREAESFEGSVAGSGGVEPELVIRFSSITSAVYPVLAKQDDSKESIFSNRGQNKPNEWTLKMGVELDGQSNKKDSTHIGIRFNNLDISPGDSVLSAYIQFTSNSQGTPGVKTILIEDEIDASSYNNSSNNISSRTYVNQTVVWNAPAWQGGMKGPDQRTSDLSSLIQTVINKPGWQAGNAIAFSIQGSGFHEVRSFNNNSHPDDKPKLVITTTSFPLLINDFPLSSQTTWSYLDNGLAPGDGWNLPDFNAIDWKRGKGEFGYGNGPVQTSIGFGSNPNDKPITTYFLTEFEVLDSTSYDSLKLILLRDDGAVVYLNGTEIHRSNMPLGLITDSTLALTDVDGADENIVEEVILPNTLINGKNRLAVEVHQSSSTSDDLSFNLTLRGTDLPIPIKSLPIGKRSKWAYLDDGRNPGNAWRMPSFDFSRWKIGSGQLGYGDGDEATTINFGTNPSSKHISNYFVKQFKVEDIQTLGDSMNLGVLSDGGAIVYVNGQEVYRSDNMPDGLIAYNTPTASPIADSLESTYIVKTISTTDFQEGTNYIAVEVHLSAPDSEDMSFDLYLDKVPKPLDATTGCDRNHEHHMACFTSISPQDQGTEIVFPSSHNFQVLVQEGESYPGQTFSVPGGNNLAAYLPDNGSSESGFLQVNHENTPGGISILDIRFDSRFQIWIRDSLNKMTIDLDDIGYTSQNASGTSTPWGTGISSERTYSPANINGDNFKDVGWNMEFDPLTRQVKQDENGNQVKLWAMGRMNHSNVAIANDGSTVYQGEYGGSSAIFKFEAANPMDLSSGTLKVLKLSRELLNGEVTIPEGSWVLVPNSSVNEQNEVSENARTLGSNFNIVGEVEIHPITGDVYFSSVGNNRIYRFKDNGNTISNFETYIRGGDYSFIVNGNESTESWMGNNANLQFDGLGNLWVTQGIGRKYLWMIQKDHKEYDPRVKLFGSFPNGSTPTGISFTPDNRFMFLSIQHPDPSNPSQMDATGVSYSMGLSSTMVVASSEILSPSPQATDLSLTNAEDCDFIDLSWTKGSGEGSLILGRVDTADKEFPRNQVTYSNPSPLFGMGNEIGIDNFVIYDGQDDSIRIQGLSTDQTYIFSVYDYIIENGERFYNISHPGQEPFSFSPVIPGEIAGDAMVKQDEVKTYHVSQEPGYSYTWNITGGSIQSGDMTEQITVVWEIPGEGTVQVTATNEQGCEGITVDYPVFVDFKTSIDRSLKELGISIYPNPTTGPTTLRLEKEYQQVRILLYDILGASKQIPLVQQGSYYSFDMKDFANGYYFMEIILDDKRAGFRLLKE